MFHQTTLVYSISFATNALILVFEITGGRLLAAYLGTSVHVWSGIIAVVLGAMALGYYYGGRYFSDNASRERVGMVLGYAGALAFIAWGVRDLAPSYLILDGFPLTVNALIVGIVLFFPTVFALAMISPALAKNLVTRVEDSARVVGAVTAVGTVGSIVGATMTGLWLIPSFGVSPILFAIPVILCVLALLVARAQWKILLCMAVGSLCIAYVLNALPNRIDAFVGDYSTAYNRILVQQKNDPRISVSVWTNPFGVQCAMYVDEHGRTHEDELVALYQKAHALTITDLFPDGPSRALFLGGCNLSFPRFLLHQYPLMIADVVEIDPGMVAVAEKFFGFAPGNFPTLSVIHEDARTFVNRSHTPYDLMHFDVFGSEGRVPFHTVTKEMFEGMSRSMTKDGVLIMNVLGTYQGEGSIMPASIVKTAKAVFPNVALYQFTNAPERSQNLVLIASHSRTLPKEFVNTAYPSVTLKHVPLRTDVIELTDSYAPVEGRYTRLLLKQ